jgi:hypothetical protein
MSHQCQNFAIFSEPNEEDKLSLFIKVIKHFILITELAAK